MYPGREQAYLSSYLPKLSSIKEHGKPQRESLPVCTVHVRKWQSYFQFDQHRLECHSWNWLWKQFSFVREGQPRWHLKFLHSNNEKQNPLGEMTFFCHSAQELSEQVVTKGCPFSWWIWARDINSCLSAICHDITQSCCGVIYGSPPFPTSLSSILLPVPLCRQHKLLGHSNL